MRVRASEKWKNASKKELRLLKIQHHPGALGILLLDDTDPQLYEPTLETLTLTVKYFNDTIKMFKITLEVLSLVSKDQFTRR